MFVKIITNTSRAQFREVREGEWQVLGIPITVDDAVMNGVLYPAAENAKGLGTYLGRLLHYATQRTKKATAYQRTLKAG